jgi:hypothetical protein
MQQHPGNEHVVDEMDAGVEMDAVGDVEQHPGNEHVVKTIAEHLERLGSDGTLDTKQLLRYAEWGQLQLSPTDEEVFRFLRSVEIGGGASDAASRASLDYAQSLGGRGLLLPKTVRTCWKQVQKVKHTIVFMLYSLCHSLGYSCCIHSVIHSSIHFIFILPFIQLFIMYSFCNSFCCSYCFLSAIHSSIHFVFIPPFILLFILYSFCHSFMHNARALPNCIPFVPCSRRRTIG